MLIGKIEEHDWPEQPSRAGRIVTGLLAVLAVVFLGVPSAFATWNFDQSQCPAPDVGYEIDGIPTPQAMIMLDRSGSMDNSITVPCTQYQCTLNGTWERNGCFMDVTIREDDAVFDDYYDFTETRECWDCTSDTDCRNKTREFFEPWIIANGDLLGDGEWHSVDEYRTTDHRTLTDTYNGTSFNCRTCRTDADCDSAFRQLHGISSSTQYSSAPTATATEASCGSSTTDSKWNIASDALNSVVTDLTATSPDTIRFGLGLFWGSDTAVIRTEAQEDNRQNILDELYGNNTPGGGTPLWNAIDATLNSTTIQGAPGATAGILVTDGAHNGYGSNSDVVAKACEHGDQANLYVVGFGSGSDEKFNNVLAAAGNTGSGCDRDALCRNPGKWDESQFYDSCQGAKLAESPAALQVALIEIVEEISCTFPIDVLSDGANPYDWDQPSQGCIDDNYDCLRVMVGNTRVFHESSSNSTVGWTFTDSDHDAVRILNTENGGSANFCDMIRNQTVKQPGDNNDVVVQRACMCVKPTGSKCDASQMAPPPQTCECPQGDWVCDDGRDICLPRDPCVNDAGQEIPAAGENKQCTVGVGACENDGRTVCFGPGEDPVCDATPLDPPEDEETTCDGIDNDCDGSVDDVVWDNDLCHVDAGLDPDAIANETNRCKIGVAYCGSSGTECQAFAPMPEVCNGIDDDCNGQIDNLSNSWGNFSEELTGRYEPAACFERNVCSCMDGPDKIEGATFDAYLESWANNTSGEPNPTCECGEGLTP
ncbi:MAG: vWA domain-containing protein [Myxococcota bacterium]